jgi:hypothetical protein
MSGIRICKLIHGPPRGMAVTRRETPFETTCHVDSSCKKPPGAASRDWRT